MNEHLPPHVHQVIEVVSSRDFKFVHIDAGIGEGLLPRSFTTTSEEEVIDCLLSPVIYDMVRREFPELQDVALTVRIKWV